MAHSPLPGFEGFYVGLLHPLSTPGQLLALLAMGAMLGLRWPEWFAGSWLAFFVLILVGICLGQLGFIPTWGERALLVLATLSGTLSALYPTGSFLLSVVLAGVAGLLIGILSTPDPGPLQPTIITLVGCAVGANLALVYVSGGIGWLRLRSTHKILQIGVRVASAWIAAISALLALLTLAA